MKTGVRFLLQSLALSFILTGCTERFTPEVAIIPPPPPSKTEGGPIGCYPMLTGIPAPILEDAEKISCRFDHGNISRWSNNHFVHQKWQAKDQEDEIKITFSDFDYQTDFANSWGDHGNGQKYYYNLIINGAATFHKIVSPPYITDTLVSVFPNMLDKDKYAAVLTRKRGFGYMPERGIDASQYFGWCTPTKVSKALTSPKSP